VFLYKAAVWIDQGLHSFLRHKNDIAFEQKDEHEIGEFSDFDEYIQFIVLLCFEQGMKIRRERWVYLHELCFGDRTCHADKFETDK
jgi:adenylate cyclase class IV